MVKNEFPVEVMFWNGIEALLFGTQSKFLFKTIGDAHLFLDFFVSKKPCTEVTITDIDINGISDTVTYPVIDMTKVYNNNYN